MNELKKCSHCKEYKPLKMFCKNKRTKDGFHFICKKCASAYHKNYRDKNKEKLLNYHKAWEDGKEEEIKKYKATYYKENKERLSAQARIYNSAHREQINERARKYRQTNREKATEWTSAYRKRYPEKYRAHLLVQYALRAGEMSRQPCEVCGIEKTEAHHDNYNRPLDVRWLCHKHHMKIHTQVVDNNINVGGEK